MGVNLTQPRPDIVYLRRRLKVGEQVTSAPVATSTGSSLNLSRAATGPTPTTGSSVLAGPDAVVSNALPTVPAAGKDSVLTAQKPVVRLNRRQSAIGSLVVANVSYVAWELTNGTTGFLYSTPESFQSAQNIDWATSEVRPALPEISPRAFKNRPVIEFHKGMLVVGLRNARSIKRIVIVPLQGKTVEVATMGGVFVTLPFTENGVMYLSVINSCVELRGEAYRGSVHQTFRIGTYAPPTPVPAPDSSSNMRDFFSGIRG